MPKKSIQCNNCKHYSDFEIPIVKSEKEVERACKRCGVFHKFLLKPPLVKTFKIKGQGIQVLTRYTEYANEHFGLDLSLDEALGLLLKETDGILKKMGK